MKRIVSILVLTSVVMGAAFAQQEQAAAVDVFPLFKGIVASNEDFIDVSISLAYERFIVSHFSIGPDLEVYFMSIEGMDGICLYFSVAAEGRYYPSTNFDKFFLGTTLGFNLLSVDGNIKGSGFAGLTASLKAGYKLKIFNRLYVEPSLSYVLSKSSALPTPLGWEGGLRLGYTF